MAMVAFWGVPARAAGVRDYYQSQIALNDVGGDNLASLEFRSEDGNTVGPIGLAEWISTMRDLASQEAEVVHFAARDQRECNLLGGGIMSLIEDSNKGKARVAVPVPRAVWPGLMGVVGVILLRWRTLRR
jgi:hypothetical protein